MTLLKSHISAIPNLSEYDKKQLLVRSADPKIGDFHLTVTALVQGEYYNEATFDHERTMASMRNEPTTFALSAR